MPSWLVIFALAAEPAAPAVVDTSATPPPRLLRTEVGAGLGLLGTAYSAAGVRWGDVHLAPSAFGRYLVGGFTTEAAVLVVAPLPGSSTGPSFTAGLGLGWSGERWSLTAGALMLWTSLARPALQWLPQLRASYSFGRFGATVGLFDQLGLVPAHLSVDLRLKHSKFSLGWVAPIGLTASADVPLRARVGLRVSGFVFKLAQAEFAMVSVAGTFDGAAR